MNLAARTRHNITIALAAALAATACGRDTNAPRQVEDPSRGRTITIHVNQAAAGDTHEVASLGALTLEAVVRDSAGQVISLSETDARIEWASTAPSVVEISPYGMGAPELVYGHAFARRNGTSRIIARMGALRDTTMLVVTQLGVRAQLTPDTVVALASGSQPVGGAPPVNDTLRVGALRVDAHGFGTKDTDPITYEVIDPTLLSIIPEPRGDTIRIVGARTGTGAFLVRYRASVDTVQAQVIDRYAVFRLVTRQGMLAASPDTVVIPAGAGIVFQNETPFEIFLVGMSSVQGMAWQVGPIPGNGREAQRFTRAGTFQFTLGVSRYVIIVTE